MIHRDSVCFTSTELVMKPSLRNRVVVGTTLATVGILVLAGALAAHDFWIVPNPFAVADGGTIEVRGQTGTKFPTSTSAVSPDRVADARVIGASSEERITDLSVSDKSLVLRHKPTSPGQRIIAVSLAARTTRTTPANLKRYIALEGNAELAERYAREGRYGTSDSLTQRSAKYAKTLVEIGRGGPRVFERQARHALEFVPVNDPATLRERDSLAVRLLFRDQPLAGAYLHAGPAAPTTPEHGATEAKDLTVTTGADGVARIPLDRSGLWNVRTLHAAPATGSTPGEWDVVFATLVFEVGSRSGARIPSTDSADVVATVERYQRALASGDSATALQLLAPDAVILESGGLQTRDEYRAHHLPADIGFARAVPSVRGPMRVVVRGDAAWTSSTTTTRGEYRGRQINSRGAELMVLSREPDGWKIRAIHWSSK
jgi:ketosteroid isomerase-like protein